MTTCHHKLKLTDLLRKYSDSTFVDGLKPVLEKLVKSEFYNTIIPGRLYPTRTSHGKILELRVCKCPNNNAISAGPDVRKSSNSVSCTDFRRTSNRYGDNESVTNTRSEVRNVARKNEDEIKLEKSEYMKRYQLTRYSDNVKADRCGDNLSTKSDKSYDSLNNDGKSNSNSVRNRNKGIMTDDSGDNNDKTIFKVLARNGSLIQEVSRTVITYFRNKQYLLVILLYQGCNSNRHCSRLKVGITTENHV